MVATETGDPAMAKTTRAVLYLRVSTGDQTVENQRRELEATAAQRGWTITATYADEGISGAKGRDKRPGLDAMLKDATRGKFDVVMCWAVDRMGRSLVDLLGTLQELHGAGVDLFLHQQAIDTTTPAGRALFGMMGVFAEFERGMIQARVKAGMERAKASPRAGAKAIGRPKVSPEVEAEIKARLTAGAGILKTARELGIGTGTVQRIQREQLTA
jgi:DNA invertase Pin-like site-specific DNA recombinase